MVRVLKGSQFYLHTPRLSAFAFPAEAGTHLPTHEGWKAELDFAVVPVGPFFLRCCNKFKSFEL